MFSNEGYRRDLKILYFNSKRLPFPLFFLIYLFNPPKILLLLRSVLIFLVKVVAGFWYTGPKHLVVIKPLRFNTSIFKRNKGDCSLGDKNTNLKFDFFESFFKELLNYFNSNSTSSSHC